MKRKPTTRFLLTFGLVSLVASSMLIIVFLGILPDRTRLERESRLAVAELLAAGSMTSLAQGDTEGIGQMLAFAIERQQGLLSAALKQTDGTIVAHAGDHDGHWRDVPDNRSTETHVVVPLYSAGQPWGRAELAFTPINAAGWTGFVHEDRFQAVLSVCALCFVGFYFYLGRMLRHLDPSRAVPARVRSALDTLAESLLLIDALDHVVLVNQSFATLVGTASDKLLGVQSSDFEWLDRRDMPIPSERLPWALTLANGVIVRNVPIALVDGTGVRRSFLANCAPILGGSNIVNGVLISLDDVTELERKEVALRAATEHAEQANRAKSEFLANMSHEIRTPMNAILGFAELMRRGQARNTTQDARYLDTIHRNGRHLLDLINDILDLSKVEAGELQVETCACEPHEVIHDVIDILSVRAEEKGIGLRFEVSSNVPRYIRTDPGRLRQIITNLVGNAIKFTPSGEIVIREHFAKDSFPPRLRISVSDPGIGIAADKLTAIFEPFTQAESSTTRRFGGTGLGLTISRRFARALGGDIAVSSEPGHGSDFTIDLPAVGDQGARHALPMITGAQAMSHTRAAIVDVSDRWHFERGRVLIVDDSPENRQLVNVVLTDAGLEVTEAGNGAEAIERMEQSSFDVVLLDMQMPVMDGYEATRRLRAAGVTTTIIAFTAHALAGFERDIEAAGCDGYLTKPIDIDAMLERLAGLIGARPDRSPSDSTGAPITDGASISASRTDSAPAAGWKTASTGLVHGDYAGGSDSAPIVSRLANQPRLHRVIHGFISSLTARLAQMQVELDTHRLDALSQSAHWLKGSAGSVGFDAFTDLARELERCTADNDHDGAKNAFAMIMQLATRIQRPTLDDAEVATSETRTRTSVALSRSEA